MASVSSFSGFRILFAVLCVTGLIVPSVRAEVLSPKVKLGLTIGSTVAAGLCSYVALTQKKQPELKEGPVIAKVINWVRRVICGNVSKKTQKLEADGSIKDVYSEASGVFGKVISFYDANEKEIKKAVAISALCALATINTDIKGILIGMTKNAPYTEFFKIVVPESKEKSK